MSPAPFHPSYLELDRFALGVPTQETTAAHVAACAACQSHLASLAYVAPASGLTLAAGAGEAASLPSNQASVAHGKATSVEPCPRPLSGRRRFTWAATGFALAATVGLAWLGNQGEVARYDTAKGAPSTAVHVKHQERVTLWDGSPLAAGDSVRIEVAPEEFEYVAVFSLEDDDRLVELYAGRVKTHASTLLPKAWKLDDTAEPERLAVFLSHARLSVRAAEILLRRRDPHEVWVERITLTRSQP